MWHFIDRTAGLAAGLFPRKSKARAWLTAVSVYASGEGDSIRQLARHFYAVEQRR